MNTETNPYQTPTATVADRRPDGEPELAGRGARLGAAIVDGIIVAAILVPVLFLVGFYDGLSAGAQPGFGASALAVLSSIVIWAAINAWFLKSSGQTVGKKLLKIRIVGLDGEIPDLTRLIGLRYGLVQICNVIPVVGSLAPLIDVLFIFGKQRRCIHDHIAKTRVVVA